MISPHNPVTAMGGDPHFSIVLPDSHMLCYTVQGEHGSVFNLISDKNVHMNALFVPNAGKRNATWIGALAIVIGNSSQLSNVTKITIDATSKSICVGDGITLAAKDVQKLHFKHGELLSSISKQGGNRGNPKVNVILEDVGLQFTVRFTQKHLEMFWKSMGTLCEDSHGLIGKQINLYHNITTLFSEACQGSPVLLNIPLQITVETISARRAPPYMNGIYKDIKPYNRNPCETTPLLSTSLHSATVSSPDGIVLVQPACSTMAITSRF